MKILLFLLLLASLTSCFRHHPSEVKQANRFTSNSLGGVCGVIRNQAGKAVPGVRIRVINYRTRSAYFSESDKSGRFRIGGLYPGLYSLETFSSEYKTVARSNLQVKSGSWLKPYSESIAWCGNDYRKPISFESMCDIYEYDGFQGTIFTKEELDRLAIK